MAAPSRSSASWERVLAAIEADAARAAALLASDDVLATAGIEYDAAEAPSVPVPSADVPATWRLPEQPLAGGAAAANIAQRVSAARSFVAASALSANPAGATAADANDEPLPDPADLPDLTPEIRERLEELQRRIDLLRAELADATAEAEAILARPAPRHTPPADLPELVDRRL